MAIAPSGKQFELTLGDQQAVVTEVGAGLRAYSAGGRELLDGYAADELAASGRGQLLLRGRTGSGTASTGSRAATISCR